MPWVVPVTAPASPFQRGYGEERGEDCSCARKRVSWMWVRLGGRRQV